MSIKEELENINFKFKKKYGQNFLTDKNLLNFIVRNSNITNDDVVLEIGPGAGTLTKAISENAKKVVSYEIDKDLIPYLEKKFYNSNVTIINKDIIKAKDQEIIKALGTKEYKIIANLPYYITTPIIMKFIESETPPKSISVMVQKEVAERLTAKPNTKEYGAITAAISLYCNCKIITNVSRNMFIPQPEVDSSVILLEKISRKENIDILKNTQKVIHSAFLRRRKTLLNNLVQDFKIPRVKLEEILKSLDIDVKIRGEALRVEEFILLSKKIFNER